MEPAVKLPPGLAELCAELYPEGRICNVQVLGADASSAATGKGTGYGVPLRLTLEVPGGVRDLVFHTASANDFGHDRRADRAAELLDAFDGFAGMPAHVQALDVGALGPGGRLISLRGAGEFYLVTTWAPGEIYATDLRRIAAGGRAEPRDLERCDALCDLLVEIHAARGGRPAAYQRAVRDLVGSGEGIFGIIDGYPADVPAAGAARLAEIERGCVSWRWRLRGLAQRLTRIHGDFHPFNVVFDGDRVHLLDASRGCTGDPADDVTCMAINYVFFALEAPAAWAGGLGELWRRFWRRYLAATGDTGLTAVAAPYLAWRGLVLANPRWYPKLAPAARDRLLGFVERTLAAERFDPASAEALFR